MKKLTIILSLIAISTQLNAQWKTDFTAGLKGGYEWNVFLNPTTAVVDGDLLLREDLWTSGFYQTAFLNGKFKKDEGHRRWKMGFKLSGSNYMTELNANRFTLGLDASYRVKFAKRKYFEVAPDFLRISQNGVSLDDAILRTPFSYTQLLIPVKLDFYLGNKAWLKTEVGYKYKNYDRQNPEEQLYYHAPFFGFRLSKKWENLNFMNKLTFSANAELRNYTDVRMSTVTGDPEEEEEDEEFDIITNGTRKWNYYRANLEYNIKPKEWLYEITFGLYTINRNDQSGRNGYFQVSPGVTASTQLKKLKVSGTARYSLRNYKNISAGEGAGNLQYKYFRLRLRAEAPLSKSTKWFTNFNYVNRESNRVSNTSLGFRGYLNSLIETGISIKF